MCVRVCDRAGLQGCWSEDGPTELGVRRYLTARSLPRKQAIVLRVCFFARHVATGGSVEGDSRVCTLREVFDLPRPLMRLVCSLLKGWSRR